MKWVTNSQARKKEKCPLVNVCAELIELNLIGQGAEAKLVIYILAVFFDLSSAVKALPKSAETFEKLPTARS